MVAFDPSIDKKIKEWFCEETGLVLSINQYGDGDPKVQVGPRSVVRKNGSEGFQKTGRLSIEDIEWISSVIDEIKEELLFAIAGKD